MYFIHGAEYCTDQAGVATSPEGRLPSLNATILSIEPILLLSYYYRRVLSLILFFYVCFDLVSLSYFTIPTCLPIITTNVF